MIVGQLLETRRGKRVPGLGYLDTVKMKNAEKPPKGTSWKTVEVVGDDELVHG